MILTLPVCAELRRAIPDVRVSMLVRRYVGPVVQNNPLVDAIVWYDDERGKPKGLPGLVGDLRAGNFDAALIVRPTPRIAWAIARAGVPVRVGTGYRYYSLLFTHRVYEHRKTAERHELEYNLQLLGALGLPVPDRYCGAGFGIHAPESARYAMERVLRSFGIRPDDDVVVLHPGSGGSARDWPAERFRALGLNLSTRKNVAVIVTGTSAEERTVRRVTQGTRPALISLAGVLQLEHLTALLERAALFVSNSTGPLHLAVAVGTPSIGLYPPVTAMSARRWGPYSGNALVITAEGPADCSRCENGTPCACMLGISVERVTSDAVRIIEEARHHRGSNVA